MTAAIELIGITKRFPGVIANDDVNLTVKRGEIHAICGENGAGKSTLLKILAGELVCQEGERKLGHNAKIGYFSQHRGDQLDPNNTVVEEVLKCAPPEYREDQVRGILGSFLFRKEDIYKKTSVLSGGEKSRLNLVKFLVDPPNLLLMDEPTTHLDILSVASLISPSFPTARRWSSSAAPAAWAAPPPPRSSTSPRVPSSPRAPRTASERRRSGIRAG